MSILQIKYQPMTVKLRLSILPCISSPLFLVKLPNNSRPKPALFIYFQARVIFSFLRCFFFSKQQNPKQKQNLLPRVIYLAHIVSVKCNRERIATQVSNSVLGCIDDPQRFKTKLRNDYSITSSRVVDDWILSNF